MSLNLLLKKSKSSFFSPEISSDSYLFKNIDEDMDSPRKGCTDSEGLCSYSVL